MTGTDHPASTADAAAKCLLAEYDGTDNIIENFDGDVRGVYWHGLHVQPLFTLKTDMAPGVEMRVTASDYCDPGRWWL